MQLLAIFRKSPFARLLFFYVAGILSANLLNTRHTCINFILIGTTLFLTAIFFLTIVRRPDYNTGWFSGFISGLILFLAGFINMNTHYQSGCLLTESAGIKGVFVMEISDPPEIKEKSVKTTAIIRGSLRDGVWKSDHQKILVYLEKDSSAAGLLPGDRILVKSTLKSVPAPKNPDAFDYSRYLATRDIYNQTYINSGLWKSLSKNECKSLRMLAYRLQEKMLVSYRKIGLNNTLFSILSALTLGYKSDLEAHTKHVFSEAGVMHVMALSGFNVAVIALAMGYLLFFSERSNTGRILKTIVIILVIWLFVLVTGLSPSVTRAAVMISFVMTGKLLQRQINTYNILFASAFILLTLTPALVSDISFQLSFAAVLGIIIYQPVLYRLVVFKNSFSNKIWQYFTLSCAAQLSTLPITLYYFHQFPVYFWLTNLYVVPLVSVIICVAGVYLLISAINPLAWATGKMLAVLLGVLYKSVAFVEILPGSLIENVRINGIQVLLLIAFILFLGLFALQKKMGFLRLALGLFIAFQLVNTVHFSILRNQKTFLVGNLQGISAINIISDRTGILLSDSTLSAEDPLLQYTFNNFWIQRGVARHIHFIHMSDDSQPDFPYMDELFHKSSWLGNNCVFEFSGKLIVVLNDNQFYKYSVGNPLKTDLVILSGNMKPDLPALLNLLNPELIILDSSVKNYQADKWIESCKRRSVRYWQVSQQGSYLLKIR